MRISVWSTYGCSSDLRATIERFGIDSMRPGDVFITTNPWIGTGHLNDVSLVKPLFHRDILVGFAATAAHRSEARRVGKACVSTCSTRWSPVHYNNRYKITSLAEQTTPNAAQK